METVPPALTFGPWGAEWDSLRHHLRTFWESKSTVLMSGSLMLINFLLNKQTSLDLLRFVVLINIFVSASWSFTCGFFGFTFLLDQVIDNSSFSIDGKNLGQYFLQKFLSSIRIIKTSIFGILDVNWDSHQFKTLSLQKATMVIVGWWDYGQSCCKIAQCVHCTKVPSQGVRSAWHPLSYVI